MRQVADFALLLNWVLAGLFLLDAARLRAQGRGLSPNLRVRVLIALGITLMGIGQRLPDAYREGALLCGIVGIGCVIGGLLNFPAAYEQMKQRPVTVVSGTKEREAAEVAEADVSVVDAQESDAEPRQLLVGGGQTPGRST